MSDAQSSNDPVRSRRQTLSRISSFVMAYAFGFKGPLVTAVTACIIAGSVLLAPSIIIGYAVKAAERDDLEHGR